MVKREKSPEIIEEVRYFAVWQPFPLNANWIFPNDQKDCATWIAECIGLEHLYGIHYKPSARGMILLEVSKLFTQHERLLGEHRWSEMLKNPDEEEEERVSRVYHSFYSKGRDAQKDGWKSLVVNASWFKNWSPGTGRFKRPYPQTYWCHVPVEDQTNKSLYRPLPVDKKPPPPRVEPPVVGSSKWIQKKNSSKPTVESLKMSYDENISSDEAVKKLNDRDQAKTNAEPSSALDLNERTTSPTSSFYPPLAGITTPAPKKIQATSNLVPLGKNKKTKFTPLSQFISSEAEKKSAPANAWAKPIKFYGAPVAPAVKKETETPLEDYSSWGMESATVTVDQENIWKSPLSTPKKSKKGKGRASTPAASSPSHESTQPPSPQDRNIPTPTISPSTVRDVPPHQIYGFMEEEDDSDCEDIYVPFSNMKFPNTSDLTPEETENAHVNAWEGGDAVDSDIPVPVEEGRKYQNLWSSEDDPRAIPLPAMVCPVHFIGCKKGICEDMAKMLRDQKKAELRAKWDKENKNKGKKKKESDDETNNKAAAEVDEDNFTKVVPRFKANRGSYGKKMQDEPSYTGRMRAFPEDPVPSDHEPDANGEKTETEGQIFDQW